MPEKFHVTSLAAKPKAGPSEIYATSTNEESLLDSVISSAPFKASPQPPILPRMKKPATRAAESLVRYWVGYYFFQAPNIDAIAL
jgi:hypothetical protein